MSGICGIVNFDGSSTDLSRLNGLLAILERRGPDRTHRWHSGAVGLGHSLLATTPEAVRELLPLADPSTGCIITADARLDNREELADRLDLGRPLEDIGDGEIILAAYRRWGADCPKYLLGDFAFAIWDPGQHLCFCARDHMGMRQLHYLHDGQAFVFSTEALSLVRTDPWPHPIRKKRVDEFLQNQENASLDETFFLGISRLLPAHSLTVSAEGLRTERYWRLEPQPELKLDSEQAYAEALLAVLGKAVQCRLRSHKPPGSMLSGGIDSSTIVALAAIQLKGSSRPRLKTFSATGPVGAECSETEAISKTSRNPDIDPFSISYSDVPARMPQLLQQVEQLEDPYDGNMSMLRAVYNLARSQGVNVVLDGAASDTVMNAQDLVAYLLSRRRWLAAVRQAWGYRRFHGFGPPPLLAILLGAWRAWAPFPLRQAGRRLRALSARSAVAEEKIDRDEPRDQSLRSRRGRAASINNGRLTVARERYDRNASAVAIEPRDPFMDIRFIEFCLSVPPDVMEKAGWPKHLLRVATKGLVPDTIRWRPGRAHLGWRFEEIVLASLPYNFAEVGTDVTSMCNKELLPQVEKAIGSASRFTGERALPIWLKLWLRNVGAISSQHDFRHS